VYLGPPHWQQQTVGTNVTVGGRHGCLGEVVFGVNAQAKDSWCGYSSFCRAGREDAAASSQLYSE